MKLLTKYYDTFGKKVLPYEQFRLFSDIDASFYPNKGFDASKINESDRTSVLKLANKNLAKAYPETLASDFIRFEREGNRSIFEGKYFTRRHMAYNFALAEAIEGEGRFNDRVMDGVMLICDEQDWVIPAHIDHSNALNPWYKTHPYIDLFSAETGSTLSVIYILMKERLDRISPIICERLKHEVRVRIIDAFLEHDMYWMGQDGKPVNNWNPWILSNILLSCALTETDTEIRERVVNRAVKCVDNFINGYHTDGGCDEGPSYWTAAGASLFDTLELLYDMTGGYVNLFGEELIRRMGEYEADFHINKSYFVNFADCPARVSPGYRMIARYGRRVNSKRLEAFGVYYNALFGSDLSSARWELYRTLKNMCEKLPESATYKPSTDSWYDGINVMLVRETDSDDRGFLLACKGGHNSESHNHNDVGTFIVYYDGEPLLPDVGVGAYTKKTFSSDRYKIWSMCSDYHNLPAINGFTQRPGAEFRAKDVVYSKESHSLKMDISAAYPKEAGIKSLVRTVSLNDGKVSVSDKISLVSNGSAEFTLMCALEPDVSVPGKIKFANNTEISYPDSLEAVIDDFDMTAEDDSIKRNWGGRNIYRVLLKSGVFTDSEFGITISHA